MAGGGPCARSSGSNGEVSPAGIWSVSAARQHGRVARHASRGAQMRLDHHIVADGVRPGPNPTRSRGPHPAGTPPVRPNRLDRVREPGLQARQALACHACEGRGRRVRCATAAAETPSDGSLGGGSTYGQRSRISQPIRLGPGAAASGRMPRLATFHAVSGPRRSRSRREMTAGWPDAIRSPPRRYARSGSKRPCRMCWARRADEQVAGAQ